MCRRVLRERIPSAPRRVGISRVNTYDIRTDPARLDLDALHLPDAQEAA
jgi:hypothetical protein